MLKRASVVVGLSGLALASGCTFDWNSADYTSTELMTIGEAEVSGATSVLVQTRAGDVTLVRTEGAPTVEAFVRAETQERADATSVTTTLGEGGRLEIGVLWPGDKRRNSESCDLRISLPEMDGVWIRSSAGDLEVAGMKGEMLLETSAGDVEVQGHDGPVTVITSAGDIEMESVTGAVSAKTSAGDIDLTRVQGPVSATTSAGDIDASMIGPYHGTIEAKTSVGDLRIMGQEYPAKSATVALGEGGDVSTFRSSVGDVHVTVTGQ